MVDIEKNSRYNHCIQPLKTVQWLIRKSQKKNSEKMSFSKTHKSFMRLTLVRKITKTLHRPEVQEGVKNCQRIIEPCNNISYYRIDTTL